MRIVLPRWKFAVLHKLLKRVQKPQLDREYAKSEFIRLLVPLRLIFLKIGKILHGQKNLDNPEDVFMLTAEEINSLVEDRKEDGYYRNMAARRKEEYQQYEKITLPDVIDDPDNIDFSDTATKQKPAKNSPVLKGIAASRGIARGYAKVVNSIGEIDKLRPGDILVTDHTDPGWTPAFVVAKAIVTNTGGLLSHTSIVAREYALPAVVNVSGATTIIKDNQEIMVNGDKGEVEIV